MENTMDNVRTVYFMAEERGLYEDLYRCKETGKVYIRKAYDDNHVRWFTSSKWSGGYEPDCAMKAGLVMRVVGKGSMILFEETLYREESISSTWADKKGPFSWEAIASVAKAFEKRFKLSSYEEWKEWLLSDAKASGYAGYSDNWLFAMTESEPPKKIAQVNILGEPYIVTEQVRKHSICDKQWICCEVQDKSMTSTLAICGFDF